MDATIRDKTGQQPAATPKNPTVLAFIEGLRKLERERDTQPLLKLFAEDCTVGNAQLDQPMTGAEGAERFWREYRDTFTNIESKFTRITEGSNTAALEWVSSGTLKTGLPITYRGVSVLALKGDHISDFMAYFDSHRFTAHL